MTIVSVINWRQKKVEICSTFSLLRCSLLRSIENENENVGVGVEKSSLRWNDS